MDWWIDGFVGLGYVYIVIYWHGVINTLLFIYIYIYIHSMYISTYITYITYYIYHNITLNLIPHPYPYRRLTLLFSRFDQIVLLGSYEENSTHTCSPTAQKRIDITGMCISMCMTVYASMHIVGYICTYYDYYIW